MSRFTEAQISQFIVNIDQRMAHASQQLANFSQSVSDVYGNWQQYAALESNQNELMAAGVAFSAKARSLVDTRKVELSQALTIIAGGIIVDQQGTVMQLQELLFELGGGLAAMLNAEATRRNMTLAELLVDLGGGVVVAS